MIDWWAANLAAVNATMKPQMAGVLSRTATGSTMNSGFLRVTTDLGVWTPVQINYTGHTYGLYGQGTAAMPAPDIAFTYKSPAADPHGMMVSIFPYDGTSVGLTTTSNI